MNDSTATNDELYQKNQEGIYTPTAGVSHRDDEYPSEGAARLFKMQQKHFWYRGRFRFVLYALKSIMKKRRWAEGSVSAIDIGGGAGGWLSYLDRNARHLFEEIALGDSSLDMLRFAQQELDEGANLYQVDAMNLGWKDRWNAIFLLDVLEHIPDADAALRSCYDALKPGGVVIATVPALKFFWSYIDEISGHVLRFNKTDMTELANKTPFEIERLRYFMFYLSPLLAIRRSGKVDTSNLSKEEIDALFKVNDRVPAEPLNTLMRWIFSLETPLGYWMPFPWGTSLLAVLTKPE